MRVVPVDELCICEGVFIQQEVCDCFSIKGCIMLDFVGRELGKLCFVMCKVMKCKRV